LRWVLGVVRGSEKETEILLLAELSSYGATPRYRVLQDSLAQVGAGNPAGNS